MNLPVKGNIRLMGEGRNWIILVVSLLLAFFMWSIMKLSRKYSSYVRYKVEVVSNIPGRKNVSVSEDVLVIGAKSTGFRIMQNMQEKGSGTLVLEDIDPRHFHQYAPESDIFYIIPDNLKQKIQDVLGTDMQVESFATDTLFFRFPEQSNKKVPVVANSVVTYGSQYMPYGPILLKPDSVLIYGDKELISQIEHITTGAINSKNVSKPLSGVIGLNQINGVRTSVDEVFYAQEVGRFVEHVVKVPVTIGNAPSYANVAVVPQEVSLRLRMPFGAISSFSVQDFSVEIEYDEILRKDVLKPVIVRKPEGILQLDMEPKFVECIL